MKTRNCGNLTVSEIGMGCMGFSHGYGQIPSEEYSIEALRKALDYGCDFLDTSEAYGPYMSETGHNEKIVGKAIKGRREDVVLATKLFIGTGEARRSAYDALRKHLEASLKRLQTDYVDLYYLHRINPDVPVERVAEGMGRLIDEGLIHGWGLSMVTVDFIDRAHKVTPVSAVQNIYSMMERDYEKKVLPYCQENNIGFVAFSPIASGFLSGMAEKKHCTNAQISLAWMLHKHSCVVPLPGSKNQERILENLRASEVELTDAEFRELENGLADLKVYGRRKDVNMGSEYID